MNTTPDFAPLAAFGAIGFILWLVFTVGIIVLSVWIGYTLIWRAVRRGMREFYSERPELR
ncbi:MAG: hypothetical protein Q7J04_01665 [Microcella sp.]|nr:hypothetical protein [Microcella sp.]